MSSVPSKWVPHNYQLSALNFIIKKPRSGLFLDPGLGKTSTSLSAIRILIKSGSIKGVLMIAPLRVCYSVWPNEIEKWINFNSLANTILHEDNKDSLWGSKKDIYLINPEGLPWLFEELLKGLKSGKDCPFDTLWIDESTKFKNSTSKRFELLCSMLPLFKRRHIMTGTPAPKSLLDLWSQAYILDEGKSLGHNYYHFRNKYFYTNDWDKHTWLIKDFSEEIIYKKISPLVLDMSAEDYLKLPSVSYNEIPVLLPEDDLKNYKKMEQQFFLELDGSISSAEAAAQASGKCHQIANGCVYEDTPEDLTESEKRRFQKHRKVIFVHDQKIQAIKDLKEELNGKPLLIAYHFKHDLEALRKAFGDNIPYIGSGVSATKSKELEKKWNEGKLEILAGHPDSMGHGLNLQASGTDICWFSLTWNLENYIQFNKRIHRQGVKNKVRIHHLISKGTIDEAIMLRLGERSESQIDLREAIRKYRKKLI